MDNTVDPLDYVPVPISKLPLAETLTGNEIFPIVQDGVARRTPSGFLSALLSSAYRFIGISSTPPTARLDGSPLQVNDIYSDLQVPMPSSWVWNGQAWQAFSGKADLALAQYKAATSGAVARVAAKKMDEMPSILDVTAAVNYGGTWDATTALTSLGNDPNKRIRITRGVHQVLTSITLTGCLDFDTGAVLQPALNVTITFNKAKINALDTDQIFDTSAGGTFAGTIRNRQHSICWFGADLTGATVCGAQINAALASRLTPRCYVPYGTYDHTGVVIEVVNTSLIGDTNAIPTILCRTDQGVDASGNPKYPAEFKSVAAMEDIIWAGPGGNGSAQYGATLVKMDGPILGGIAGGSSQTKFKRVTFTNYRMGLVINETNGHVWFDTCHWLGNFASMCVLQTGGDYTFIDCDAGSERCAVFYIPRNGSMGTNWNIRGNFYYRLMPWFVVQDSVDDLRSPYPAGVTRPIIAGVQEWQAVNGEQIGNGFMNLVPTDSYFGGVRLKDCGWASGNAAYQVKTGNFQRTDYSWIVGLMSFVTAISNGQGVNFWAPGTLGIVFTTSGSSSINFYDFQAPSAMNGKVYAQGPGYKYIRPLLYVPPFVNIPIGTTNFVYTMTQVEAEVMASAYGMLASMVARNNQNGFVPPYRLTVNGTSLTITFQTATTAQFYATLDLLRRPG